MDRIDLRNFELKEERRSPYPMEERDQFNVMSMIDGERPIRPIVEDEGVNNFTRFEERNGLVSALLEEVSRLRSCVAVLESKYATVEGENRKLKRKINAIRRDLEDDEDEQQPNFVHSGITRVFAPAPTAAASSSSMALGDVRFPRAATTAPTVTSLTINEDTMELLPPVSYFQTNNCHGLEVNEADTSSPAPAAAAVERPTINNFDEMTLSEAEAVALGQRVRRCRKKLPGEFPIKILSKRLGISKNSLWRLEHCGKTGVRSKISLRFVSRHRRTLEEYCQQVEAIKPDRSTFRQSSFSL